MTDLVYSNELGKRVRAGDWRAQTVPTVTLVERAHAEGRGEDAAELVEYFVEEARVCHAIYDVWHCGFLEWLKAQGVAAPEVEAELAPFAPGPAWEALRADAASLAERLRAGGDARGLEELRESWRRLHDGWVDVMAGVLAFVAGRLGEDALDPCYRHVLEPYIQERYMPYDLRERPYEETLWRNLYTTFEAMRGHLCGPGRRGDVELVEDDEKWIVSFDPCGSGGRTLRERPYRFGVTEQRHDWSWNEAGVCHYCAHCCFALELLPAERWGHPVRVVDPPLYPHEAAKKCTWTIYKSLDAIPETAYRRIGRAKPAVP